MTEGKKERACGKKNYHNSIQGIRIKFVTILKFTTSPQGLFWRCAALHCPLFSQWDSYETEFGTI